MNITKLSYKNMMSRPLSTALSLILLTLGVGIIALTLQISLHIQEQMENNVRGIDMVVGAKGSPLQLILSAVYHVDAPTGNIPLNAANQLKKNRLVKYGIPLSYGDNYQGYRIVGTTHQYPQLYDANTRNGRLWKAPFEVTVGASVAQALGLKTGDSFTGSHGLAEGGETHHEHAYLVVGILNYTNSVLDQLILTSTESVWEIHEHHDHETDATEADGHEPGQQITAMLIKFRNPMGMIQLPRLVNESTSMQAALPVYEISRLFSLLGVGMDTLRTIALIIMGVSGLSVFISLYNNLKDRQYEMALMRTYGASRWQLVLMTLQEGLLLSLAGLAMGLLCSRIGLIALTVFMKNEYHYAFTGIWKPIPQEGVLAAFALLIGLMAALIPAIRVFSINISKTLADA